LTFNNNVNFIAVAQVEWMCNNLNKLLRVSPPKVINTSSKGLDVVALEQGFVANLNAHATNAAQLRCAHVVGAVVIKFSM
jgi:hypothetical protein